MAMGFLLLLVWLPLKVTGVSQLGVHSFLNLLHLHRDPVLERATVRFHGREGFQIVLFQKGTKGEKLTCTCLVILFFFRACFCLLFLFPLSLEALPIQIKTQNVNHMAPLGPLRIVYLLWMTQHEDWINSLLLFGKTGTELLWIKAF